MAPVEIDSDWVTNPGYEDPPDELTYYFNGRGNEHWDDIHRSDFSLNYGFFIKSVELFFQRDVLNVFNESGRDGGVTTINILNDFNPYTTTPPRGWVIENSEFRIPNSEFGIYPSCATSSARPCFSREPRIQLPKRSM